MRSTVDYIKNNKLLLLVLIPAFLVHMLIIMPSGSSYCSAGNCGLFFWGAHSHDAIWHLAIISTSFSKLPFIAPTFAGSLLAGYNYLLDLCMFVLSKAGISPLFSYFKLFPILWFILMTGVTVSLARKLHQSGFFTGILLFFVYFAGSFSYLLTLYHHNTIWGSSGLLAMQSGLVLTNLQLAFSFVVLFFILKLIKDESKNSILLSILVGINFALKFYAGAVSLFIVCLFFIGKNLRNKSFKNLFVSLLMLSVISSFFLIVFYNPSQSLKSGSVFTFSPFATVHSIIEEPEQFYLKDMVNARYYLQSLKIFSPKLIRIELYSLLLFIFFNFGTRSIGFFTVFGKLIKRKLDAFDIYLFLTMAFAVFMAVFFIQKGIWWNTIQFLYYALFLGNIFAAEAVYFIWKRTKWAGAVITAVIVLLTIPTSMDIFRGFFTFPAASYVSFEEIRALEYLKKQPHGVVLAPIFNPDNFEKTKPPIPLSQYDDNSYVSAFSGKPTYANDKVQLELLGLPYSTRYNLVEKSDCSVLKSVQYIYQPLNSREKFFAACIKSSKTIREIFRNKSIVIYKM